MDRCRRQMTESLVRVAFIAAALVCGMCPLDARAAAPPRDAVVLFDGTDLSAWVGRGNKPAQWKVENGYMEVVGKTGGIRTKERFGDCQLHIEWATPSVVKGNGQGRGNSGVFPMSQYEIQVLDSYNNTTYPDGQAGGIYGQYPPLVNVCRGPGEWQSYNIVFRAPRFSKDKKITRPARMTVLHNGVVIHHDVVLVGPCMNKKRRHYRAHPPKLPISLQDHGNPMRFRNIWTKPLPAGGDKPYPVTDLQRMEWELANLKWKVNDPKRPQPPVVAPGAPSAERRPDGAPADVVVLFDGKKLSGWETGGWRVENGQMVGKGDLSTQKTFNGCHVRLEAQLANARAGVAVGGQEIVLSAGAASDQSKIAAPLTPGKCQVLDIACSRRSITLGDSPREWACVTVLVDGAFCDERRWETKGEIDKQLPVVLRNAAGSLRVRSAWVREFDPVAP